MTQNEKWMKRVLARVKQLGLQDADVNRSMSDGGKGTFMTDLRKGRVKSPRIDNFAKLARILRWSVGELHDGEGSAPATLFIEGVLKGKEMWSPTAKTQKREVELSFFDRDLAVLEIGTNELSPAYRMGDVVAGTKTVGRHLDNLIGRDCIIETTDGERLLKYLHRGGSPGTWLLRSFDPATSDVDNVRIAWAAPIQMIIRGAD